MLCIDDEPQLLRYLEELFVLNGFDVDVALDGTTGRALALANRYHALVVDLLLQPQVSGLDVIRAVRAAGRSGAILVFTGHPSHRSAIEATQLGVPYLVKAEVKGLAIVDAVLNAIAASTPPNLSLFRTTPGPSPAILDLVRTIDDVRGRWSATNADAVRKHVRQGLARVLASFDLTFLEFAAAAEGFRTLNKADHHVAVVLPVVARNLDKAARRAWSDVDPRLRHLVEHLEQTGQDWKTVDELTASEIVGIEITTLRRILAKELALAFPRIRWSIVLRRVVLQLAATYEQVAQIAYLAGFTNANRLNDVFAEFLGTTPTEYRRLLGADDRVSSAS